MQLSLYKTKCKLGVATLESKHLKEYRLYILFWMISILWVKGCDKEVIKNSFKTIGFLLLVSIGAGTLLYLFNLLIFHIHTKNIWIYMLINFIYFSLEYIKPLPITSLLTGGAYTIYLIFLSH